MADGYKTLGKAGSDSFIIKKSRFIGHGSPAATEREALDFLAGIRAQHRDASHHCWAYIIGTNAGIMRYSDDGEPGGTAGLPIMEVLKARGVVNCAVVVTRYFGGVLLGASGLVRAYTQGAKTALDAAGVVVMERSARFWVGVEYILWGRVEHYLQSAPVRCEQVEFAATVTATLLTRKRDEDAVFQALTALTDGQAALLPLEECDCDWAEEG